MGKAWVNKKPTLFSNCALNTKKLYKNHADDERNTQIAMGVNSRQEIGNSFRRIHKYTNFCLFVDKGECDAKYEAGKCGTN